MYNNTGIQVRRDETDKFRAAASDAILLRGGIFLDKPEPGAQEFQSIRLKDLAAECVQRKGIYNAHRMDDDTLYREALSPDSHFSSILSDAAGKTVSNEYKAANATFQAWTRKGSNPNFKHSTRYQISEAGNLEKISQYGEFKFDEMTDQGVTASVATFGRSWGFTRQAMINDDISVLTRVPARYARAAARGINKLVYKMLGENPVIYDGIPLFHESHNNTALSGGAINTDSVGNGRAAMRTQKGLRRIETLNVSPVFMLVPVERETDAVKFIKSPGEPGSIIPVVPNIFNNKLKIISDACLDDYSPYAWYLAADPDEVDTIEVTYLNGNEIPIIESNVSFEVLGIKFRIYIDYGVTVLDFRGLYKNPGM